MFIVNREDIVVEILTLVKEVTMKILLSFRDEFIIMLKMEIYSVKNELMNELTAVNFKSSNLGKNRKRPSDSLNLFPLVNQLSNSIGS